MINNKRQAMLDRARSIVAKAKWRHRGRKPWAVDCIGIIVLALEASGWNIQNDRDDYGREPWREGLRKQLKSEFGEPITLEDALPGDIAVFQFPNKEEPSHIAILGDSPNGGFTIIHAHLLHGVREHDLRGAWERLLVEVYRTWPT